MTCHEFWNAMPELAEETDVFDHVRECPSCAALLERQRALAAGLKQIAAERQSLQAPPALETRLLEAFRNQTAPRRASAGRYWLTWAAAAAAVLVVSFFLVRGRAPQLAKPADLGLALMVAGPGEPGGSDSDFIPLPYGALETGAVPPAEDDDLVRVEIPRSALLALGVPLPADSGTGRVEAVVALGADGMLEGVRVLQ
jgi:hypothetical protein